jgi:hypothetical protein
MGFPTLHHPSSDAYTSWDADAATPRFSERASLALVAVASLFAYALVYEAANFAWRVFTTG